MKLVVNGFFLNMASTGSGQYTAHLLREVSRLWEGETVVLTPDFVETGGTSTSPRAERHHPGASSDFTLLRLPVRLKGNLGKLWFEQVALPLAARGIGANLLHVPYFAPPLFSPCPVVVTIHDLVSMAWPDARPSVSVRFYSALAALGARRAGHLIADSQHTKKDVMAYLGVPDDRVSVVYLGPPLDSAPTLDKDDLTRTLAKYGLEKDQYILYVGGLDRRKNVTTLLRAFAKVQTTLPLALAGQPRSSNLRNFPDLITEVEYLNLQERTKFLGWIAEEDKPFLYTGAAFFVYPSAYEGFGLPPLEAMACGTPVLCSNATSLPEVVGDAALTFDPGDTEALGHLIGLMARDGTLRDDLRRKGTRQVARFSWRKTAEETMSVYRKALHAATGLREQVTR